MKKLLIGVCTMLILGTIQNSTANQDNTVSQNPSALPLTIEDLNTAFVKHTGIHDNQSSLADRIGIQDNQSSLAKRIGLDDNQGSIVDLLGVRHLETPLADRIGAIVGVSSGETAPTLKTLQNQLNGMAGNADGTGTSLTLDNLNTALAKYTGIHDNQTPLADRIGAIVGVSSGETAPTLKTLETQLNTLAGNADGTGTSLTLDNLNTALAKHTGIHDNQSSLADRLGIQDNQSSLVNRLGIQDNQSSLANRIGLGDKQGSIVDLLGVRYLETPLADRIDAIVGVSSGETAPTLKTLETQLNTLASDVAAILAHFPINSGS